MPPRGSYRFQVGTDVQCRTVPEEWCGGKIIALDYRDQSWPMGKTVPYQVELQDGRWIYVPKDLSMLCRKLVIPSWEKAVASEDLQMLKDSVSRTCEQTSAWANAISSGVAGWQMDLCAEGFVHVVQEVSDSVLGKGRSFGRFADAQRFSVENLRANIGMG
eukprot:TRINITY_DN14524_c0_g1_i1.p1 TRINITY_DN14524_c0_g1~~TRINITY_DN14524_c0_g1_i1.p1  ORF type:complete len:161 (-),score=18.06 TRINITY_DN14524_c0_g1_i1:25-507(-)